MRAYRRLCLLLTLFTATSLVLLFYAFDSVALPSLDGGAGGVVGVLARAVEGAQGSGSRTTPSSADDTAAAAAAAALQRNLGLTWNMSAEYYGSVTCDDDGSDTNEAGGGDVSAGDAGGGDVSAGDAGGGTGRRSTTTLFVYVYTAPRNVEKRKKIRSTWGSVRSYRGVNFRVVFFIGRVMSYALQLSLAKEMRQYKDLVQDKSYIDSYRNLTRKGLSSLLWATRYCRRLLRIVKVDDDTLVHPYNLIDLLSGLPADATGQFVCPVTASAKPIRKPEDKYFVSVKEFSGEYYPMYCQGYAYTIPPEAVAGILEAALNSTLISMEDVFITGLLAASNNVTHYPLSNFYSTTFKDSSTEDLIGKLLTRPNMTFLGHSKHMVYYDLFWKLVSREEKAPESAP